MSLPTIFYLTFKANCCGEYDVFVSHKCQEKGCLWTSDEFVNTCIPGKEAEFVEEYNKNLTEGKVTGYEVEGYLEVE